jgi:hypothetical protein
MVDGSVRRGLCSFQWVLPFALCGCSVYDVSLLNTPEKPPVDTMHAGSGGGGSGGSGSGGADAGQGPRCGDGLLTGDERCDIAIPAGEPGACPSECMPAGQCAPRVVSGSACNAECVVLQLTCSKGDGCCPGNCTTKNDGDCSSSCGDGIVQSDNGETCDPGHGLDGDEDAGAAAAAGEPCPTIDDCEDRDACTTDLLIGSEKNCNAMCTHVTITEVKSGDGCCPPGANNAVDHDCKPVCGNGVKEGDEECDGGEHCVADTCRFDYTDDQRKCMSLVDASDACNACSCLNCTPLQLACRASNDKTRNDHCTAIENCANENDCVRTACYCKDPADPWGCGFGDGGPCRAEIDAAAQAEDPDVAVQDQANDTRYSVGRAAALSDCNVDKCKDVCP